MTETKNDKDVKEKKVKKVKKGRFPYESRFNLKIVSALDFEQSTEKRTVEESTAETMDIENRGKKVLLMSTSQFSRFIKHGSERKNALELFTTIADHYDPKKKAFNFNGEWRTICVEEIAYLLGLPSKGHIAPKRSSKNAKTKINFVTTISKNLLPTLEKKSRLHQENVLKMLKKMEINSDEDEVTFEKLFRFYILSFVYPSGSNKAKISNISLVDLTTFDDINWAKEIHTQLMNTLDTYKKENEGVEKEEETQKQKQKQKQKQRNLCCITPLLEAWYNMRAGMDKEIISINQNAAPISLYLDKRYCNTFIKDNTLKLGNCKHNLECKQRENELHRNPECKTNSLDPIPTHGKKPFDEEGFIKIMKENFNGSSSASNEDLMMAFHAVAKMVKRATEAPSISTPVLRNEPLDVNFDGDTTSRFLEDPFSVMVEKDGPTEAVAAVENGNKMDVDKDDVKDSIEDVNEKDVIGSNEMGVDNEENVEQNSGKKDENMAELTEKEKSKEAESEKKKKHSRKNSAGEKDTVQKKPKTPEAFVIDRPVRMRKSVERLVDVIDTDTKETHIEKGPGDALKDIPNVAYKLSKRKLDETLKVFHTILFGRRGKDLQIKNNILQFSGFVWHGNEEKQRLKVREKLDKYTKEKLLDFCDFLDMQIPKATSRKEDIIVKLIEFLESPHATTSELLSEKEQSTNTKKRERNGKGTTLTSDDTASKASSKGKKNMKSSEDGKKLTKPEIGDESDEEQEDQGEEEHENANGAPVNTKDDKIELTESEEEKDIGAESEKSSSKENSGEKVVKANEQPEEVKPRPSDVDLKTAICEILNEIDIDKVSFNDILKLLAERFKTDLTTRKESIRLIVQEELNKLAEYRRR